VLDARSGVLEDVFGRITGQPLVGERPAVPNAHEIYGECADDIPTWDWFSQPLRGDAMALARDYGYEV